MSTINSFFHKEKKQKKCELYKLPMTNTERPFFFFYNCSFNFRASFFTLLIISELLHFKLYFYLWKKLSIINFKKFGQ